MTGMSSGRQDHTTDPRARSLRPLLAGAGALLATGLLAAPAQAAFPGSNGRVVYERTPANLERAPQAYSYWDDTELWTADASGGDLRRLVSFQGQETPASAHDPSVSPDGTQVAYVESGEADSRYERIRIVGLDGSAEHLWREDLTDASAPAWSPDGTKLVFVREGQFIDRGLLQQSPSDAHLVIGNADGSGELQTLEIDGLEGDARNPQWSPDGKTIAFDSNRRVYVVPAAGGTATLVGKRSEEENAYIADAFPNWAPDGSAILFQRYVESWATRGRVRAAAVDGADQGSHLIEVPFSGGAPRNADETPVIGSSDQPDRGVYSPDGLKLLYSGFRYEPSDPGRAFKGIIPTSSLIVAGAEGSDAKYFIAPKAQDVLIASDWAPIPKPKTTPAPPPVTVTVTPQGEVKGETARRCGSRRNFVIRLRPRGAKLAMARVIVNGKRISAKKGKRWTATVDLRTLPKKRFKVDITVWTKDGRRFHEVRRYWTCTPAR